MWHHICEPSWPRKELKLKSSARQRVQMCLGVTVVMSKRGFMRLSAVLDHCGEDRFITRSFIHSLRTLAPSAGRLDVLQPCERTMISVVGGLIKNLFLNKTEANFTSCVAFPSCSILPICQGSRYTSLNMLNHKNDFSFSGQHCTK